MRAVSTICLASEISPETACDDNLRLLEVNQWGVDGWWDIYHSDVFVDVENPFVGARFV